jgi:hypothetical protein
MRRNWLLLNAYTAMHLLRKKLWTMVAQTFRDSAKADKRGVIYAPHGALIAFHRRYFRAGSNPFEHDAFLFNEEITVAEGARQRGLQVLFVPDVVVRHHEHVSTGWFRDRATARMLYEAMDMTVRKHFSSGS